MKTLFRSSARGWGWVLLRGLVLIAFGLLAALSPVGTALSVVWVIGLYACIDGILLLLASSPLGTQRRPLIWLGLIGVLLGLVSLLWPQLALLLVLSVIGSWLLIVGLLQAIAAYRLPAVTAGRSWLAISGLLSVLFGLLLLAHPAAALTVLMTVFAVWALLSGVLIVLHGWQLRRQGPAF